MTFLFCFYDLHRWTCNSCDYECTRPSKKYHPNCHNRCRCASNSCMCLLWIRLLQVSAGQTIVQNSSLHRTCSCLQIPWTLETRHLFNKQSSMRLWFWTDNLGNGL